MKTIKIENSSAISQINIDEDQQIVGVAYTSNESKIYEFFTEDVEYVENKISETLENGESVGKLIHSLKKEGMLEVFITEEK
jgi:hypothetical protein